MKRVKTVLKIIFLIYSIFVLTTIFSKNEFNYSNIGNFILVPSENYLTFINKNTYKDIDAGDKIYYYEFNEGKYKIGRKEIESKLLLDNEIVYTFTDSPNILIKERLIIGKKTFTLKNIAPIYKFFTSKHGVVIFIFLPLLIVTIKSLNNLIELCFSPVKTNINQIKYNKFKKKVKLKQRNVKKLSN